LNGNSAAGNGAANGNGADKEKVTYKISGKELNDIEQKRADKASSRKLESHWANFSFYFMASLSFILPALFLGKLSMPLT
jgi:hypothetical protein